MSLIFVLNGKRQRIAYTPNRTLQEGLVRRNPPSLPHASDFVLSRFWSRAKSVWSEKGWEGLSTCLFRVCDTSAD